MAQEHVIYDFDSKDDRNDWIIENDGVMGGLSQSSMSINKDGHGVFTGQISLENNGGFASVRHETDIENVKKYKYVVLRVKGKPSTYQFRLKKSLQDPESYVQDFDVTSEWENVKLDISTFYPTYRGRNLDLPKFDADVIKEVRILIGNKVEEEFKLQIDKIYLSNS